MFKKHTDTLVIKKIYQHKLFPGTEGVRLKEVSLCFNNITVSLPPPSSLVNKAKSRIFQKYVSEKSYNPESKDDRKNLISITLFK